MKFIFNLFKRNTNKQDVIFYSKGQCWTGNDYDTGKILPVYKKKDMHLLIHDDNTQSLIYKQPGVRCVYNL